MEQVKVDTPREAPPDWAKPTAATVPDPNRATERQMNFIEGLLQERELTRLSPEQLDFLNSESAMTTLSKENASKIITRLLDLPKKPKPQEGVPAVPAGRYAVEANDGKLRFYKVWKGRNGFTKLYVQHGPDETQMNFKTMVSVMNKILAAGVRECAIRYGMEIGACSNCGRRLTNHISRALGIGPVCGGRMFGDDFKFEVKAKRAELQEQGINPDDEVE